MEHHLRKAQKAGCVPVRQFDNGEWQVLFVTANNSRRSLVLPKGGVEKGETLKMAAERETLEEAGVIGQMRKGSVGKLEYTRSGNYIVQKMWILYVTTVLDESDARWKESGERDRHWMSFAQARETLVSDNAQRANPRPELVWFLDKALGQLKEHSSSAE